MELQTNGDGSVSVHSRSGLFLGAIVRSGSPVPARWYKIVGEDTYGPTIRNLAERLVAREAP